MMNTFLQCRLPASQRGATLLIGLIMLVLMTLVALTAFNLGQSNLQIVGNVQHRNEAISVAEAAVEEVVSNPTFYAQPTSLLPSGSNVKSYDVNSDGKDDIRVTVSSTCAKGRMIPVDELMVSNPEDQACITGVGQTFGAIGTATGDSMCASTLWDVKAEAVDAATKAKVVIFEGVDVRVSRDIKDTYCN